MTNNCEYAPAHPDTDQTNRPDAVTMVSVRHVELPEECPSTANVKLCEDCAVNAGVLNDD